MSVDPGTIISGALALLTSIGFGILLFVIYRNGKKAAKIEQGEHDAKIKDALQVESSKPKSTSAGDRDSLHNGDF